MEWWLWLVFGGVFGIVVIAAAILLTLSQLTQFQLAVTAADEHRKSAERLRARAERVQTKLRAESEGLHLPQRGTIR